MKKEEILALFQEYEQVACEVNQVECWSARDLQKLLGYSLWQNFTKVIAKAKEACENVGQNLLDHFIDVNKMVELGSGAFRSLNRNFEIHNKTVFDMRYLFLLLTGLVLAVKTWAQSANYDESLVCSYVLPDALTTLDGQKVTDSKMWEKVRRPEIMSMLANVEYGNLPQTPVKTTWRTVEESDNALGGKALRRQVEFTFSGNGVSRKMMVLMYMPRGVRKAPVFISPNFRGNQSTTDDEAVIASQYSEYSRSNQKSRWPFEKIIASGYAVATFHYFDIYYDKRDSMSKSILPVFGVSDAAGLSPSTGKAISAWSWACSRVLDYVLTLKNIDKRRCIVMGHSRLGKTALWAGALDKRFAMVVSNNSGCCGAALSRRNYGETVGRITKAFPWWFCDAFCAYADRPEELPFDQHELLAMIAPRLVYVASAQEDRWADPRGEFLALKESSKVYAFYGKETMGDEEFPEVNKLLWRGQMGYHIRSGGHDVTDFDWDAYMRFADEKLK